MKKPGLDLYYWKGEVKYSIVSKAAMPTITVDSVFEERVLVLSWDKGSVSLTDKTPETLSEWEYLQSRGLSGKYGHWVNPKNCLLSDLVIALNIVAGPDNVHLDGEAQGQLDKEIAFEENNPIPTGAMH